MPDGHHAVGWSVFGLAIIAVAGVLSVNHVLLAGIEATRARQTRAAQAISAVRQRTQQWPQTEKDPLLNEADRSRLKSVNVSFKLSQVDPEGHSASYSLRIGERRIRLDVPERM
jgi:hypothetical protein